MTTREIALKAMALADCDLARIQGMIDDLRAQQDGFRDISRAAMLTLDECSGEDTDWHDEPRLADALEARPLGTAFHAHYAALAKLLEAAELQVAA